MPDTDATAIAVLQLASQSGNGTVNTAIGKAKAWLVAQQESDGSWGGGASTEDPNANSTSPRALRLWERPLVGAVPPSGCERTGDRREPDRAREEPSASGVRSRTNSLKLAAGRTNGITGRHSDQWRRASAQALPGLAYLPQDTTHPTRHSPVPLDT